MRCLKHCSLTVGIVQFLGEMHSFSEALPSKSCSGYCGRRFPTWNTEMCYLSLLPIQAGVPIHGLPNTNPHCHDVEKMMTSERSETRVGWVVDSHSLLAHLLNSRLFQFYQLCPILGVGDIREANDQKEKRTKTKQFLLTSGVSSANITERILM